MKPYWESKLTLEEAQKYSENGIAILGNPAMKDIVWEKNSPNPKIWINKGYRDAAPERFRNRIGWVPDKPTKEYVEMDAAPKPVDITKWKLDEARNVFRYEKDGNWAEIDASLNPDGDCYPTKLYIKGELKEFVDYGWTEREHSMDYCEWQVDHPNGLALRWWEIAWRLCVIFLALTFIFFAFIR